jgi:hypothetical protein
MEDNQTPQPVIVEPRVEAQAATQAVPPAVPQVPTAVPPVAQTVAVPVVKTVPVAEAKPAEAVTPEAVAPEAVAAKPTKGVASNYLKAIVFSVLTLSIVVGNFFFESSTVASNIDVPEEIVFDYSGENIINEYGIIRFPENKVHDLDSDVRVLSESDGQYVFDVKKAHLWADFSLSTDDINFIVDDLVLVPRGASFELFFDGNELSMQVYDGDVYLGLLNEGIELNEFQDQYSSMFMNRMLVPRDTQVSFAVSKLDEDLYPLLNSKLVKELKLSGIASSQREELFVVDNIDLDKSFELNIKQDFESSVLRKGAHEAGGIVSDIIFWSEANLSFVPDKKSTILVDHAFVNLADAIFYASEDMDTEQGKSIAAFEGEVAKLPFTVREGDYFAELYDSYVKKLSVYGPTDNLYSVLVELLDSKFHKDEGTFDVVNNYWLDIYKAMPESDLAAEEALDNYYSYFDQTLGDIGDENSYTNYLIYNNQLFDNLLLRYSVFYKHGYFVIKNAIEQNVLSRYNDPEDVREISQSFIDNKIDFLKRLRKHFFKGEIEVSDTKDIFESLLNEVDDLMPADSSSVAILELFKSELDDIEDFYGYLRSTEYHSLAYGTTHEDRFEVYLEERDKIWSFVDIQEDVLGEVVADKEDVIDVAGSIENVINSAGELTDLTVGEIKQVDQRYVDVSGVIGGYPFDAIYDRDIDSLKDIYVYGELVSESPIKVSALLTVLYGKFSDLAEESGEENVDTETYAQRAARNYIAEKVSEFGFEISIDDIILVNEQNAIYNIKEITIVGHPDKVVTFDILMAGDELVTNILVYIDGRLTLLDGKFTLDELSSLIEAGNIEEEAEEYTYEDEEVEDSGGGVLR